MHKIFISGSMKIRNLDENVLSRINNILNSKYEVLVGDANGVDSSIQEYLKSMHSKSVVVYCAGDNPRNNIGHWTVEKIRVNAKSGTRAFYTAKDIQMADDCDYGFMVWDTKSTGTLSNTIELLKRKKKSLVYINKLKEFIKIQNVHDLESLISHMSEFAKNKAEEKLGLRKTISSFKNEQISLL